MKGKNAKTRLSWSILSDNASVIYALLKYFEVFVFSILILV